MRKNDGLIMRIERVQKWFNENPGLHVNELLADLNEIPRGTLTSLISQMLSSGHLVRHRKGFYTLPELTANARSVLYDIKKGRNVPTLFQRMKSESRPKITAKNTEVTNSSNQLQPVTNNEQISQDVLGEFKRNKDIMGAVDTLKKYGLKVTIEF